METVSAAPAPAATSLVRSPSEAGVLGEAAVPRGDGPSIAGTELERRLSTQVARPLAEFEPVRVVHVTARELRGLELLTIEQAEPLQILFNLITRTERAAAEELQRTLRPDEFADQFDRLRADVEEKLQLDKSITISVAGVSFGLSLVYVLWLIRGGVLMGSYLSALPAWRVLDPLPILSRVDEEEDDEEAVGAVSDRGGNPLRGFG